jgi:hypothetical protein
MKKIVIGCAIVLVLCICCSSIIALGVWGFNSMMADGISTKNTTVLALCSQTKKFDENEFSDLFTDNFRKIHTLDETMALVDAVFPSGADCQSFITANFWEAIQKGQNLMVRSTNGESTITFDLGPAKSRYEFQMKQEDGKYKINTIVKIENL